jgi:hypothetical protein
MATQRSIQHRRQRHASRLRCNSSQPVRVAAALPLDLRVAWRRWNCTTDSQFALFRTRKQSGWECDLRGGARAPEEWTGSCQLGKHRRTRYCIRTRTGRLIARNLLHRRRQDFLGRRKRRGIHVQFGRLRARRCLPSHRAHCGRGSSTVVERQQLQRSGGRLDHPRQPRHDRPVFNGRGQPRLLANVQSLRHSRNDERYYGVHRLRGLRSGTSGALVRTHRRSHRSELRE